MISLHIRATVDPTQILESQHAYTKGKSIESALHLVVSSIEKSLSIKEYTLIAFLDIEGAFNNVLPTAITQSLTELGFEPPMVRLIHNLLIGRMVTATLGTSTQTRLVNRGTLQGGVALLWNIAVNRLLRILEGGGCKVVAYADDVAIIFKGKYPQTLCDLMTAKHKILSEWTIANLLGVSPLKTELVLILESQHAYTKGKSIESALHLVVSSIEKSLSIKEYTLIAFLDIEGAFNNVLPTAITQSLTELGFEPPMVRLIHNLLIGRMVTATLGTSTQTRLVNRGTLQGGVALLWNIAVNRLLRILEGGGCKVVAYADDVAIIFKGKYPQTLCDLMTAKHKILSEWTIANLLGVSPLKTELVLFTNRYKIQCDTHQGV